MSEPYCYLTTTGRVSGEPREIEIWFEREGRTVYLLSGGRDRSNWVRNLMADPAVTVRIGDETFAGTARIVDEAGEDALARRLLHAKYSTGPDHLATGATRRCRWRSTSARARARSASPGGRRRRRC